MGPRQLQSSALGLLFFPQKKRGVYAIYSIAVRQNLYGINTKTHAMRRESVHSVFRIFKILPISIESQEQSSNLCQKLDYLMKTSFFSNIIKFSQGMHAKACFLHFFNHRIKFTTSLTMVSRSSGLLSAMSSVSATRAPSLKILEPSTR